MTDRELLELAAKAAGIASDGLGNCYDMEREVVWDPLTDDGDALRLAVKLNLMVQFNAKHVFVCDDAGVQLAFIGKKDDPYAATRRAIVRAAGIGRNMK